MKMLEIVTFVGGKIYEFQTLIAGLMAIGAAYIAASPLYTQLDQMRVQTAAARRDGVVKNLHRISSRRDLTMKLFNDIIEQIEQTLFDNAQQTYLAENMDSHCAFTISQNIASALGKLKSVENDPAALISTINETRAAFEELYECLDALHRPDSFDWIDEFTAEKNAQIEADIITEGLTLRPQLLSRLTTAKKARDSLGHALIAYLNTVKNTLAKIDAHLMRG